jgi:hypothetical protein
MQGLVAVVDRVLQKLIDLFRQLSHQPRIWNMTFSASLVHQGAMRNVVVEYYGIKGTIEVHTQVRRRGASVKGRV